MPDVVEIVTVAPDVIEVNAAALPSLVEVVPVAPDLVEVNAAAMPEVVEIVSVAPDVIEVITAGPQGPQGPKGDRGEPGAPGGTGFTFEQDTPSAEWNITHPLGKKPSVTVVDSADTVVIGGVEYLSDSEVRVTFSAAFAGKAYLN